MVAEVLEVAVITYNRAAALERTLEQLAASPFAGCRLTVLDNCSTDATPEVCARFAERFPEFRVVRHVRNIGAEANYLRAVEVLDRPYGWVLCDDDDLDFSDCDDVIAAIEEGEVDVLSVGAPARSAWSGGRTTMGALRDESYLIYSVFVFMPNTIYRTAAIDAVALVDGYRNVQNLYPMFPFVRRLIERDAPVHVSRTMLVRRGGVTVPVTPMYWFVRWVRCASTVPEPGDRRLLVRSAAPGRVAWLRMLGATILQEKLYRPEAVKGELWELLGLLRGGQRAALLLLAPLALVPTPTLAAAKRRLTGQDDAEGPRFAAAAAGEQGPG
jgi:glycosyltransferase involved in cell wall biosynthesis